MTTAAIPLKPCTATLPGERRPARLLPAANHGPSAFQRVAELLAAYR